MSRPGLRGRLRGGGPLFGAWLMVPSPIVAEAVAVSGFDYVGIDCQHGFIGFESLWPMLQVLGGRGVPALVRVRSHDPAFIGQALDSGAAGVIVPMVESPEQAARLALACRFPPVGERSRGGGRGAVAGGPTAAQENAEVLCLPMIENAAGVRNADAIAATEGVDGLYIGPNDLAVSLGVDPAAAAGDRTHRAAVTAVLAACRRAGRVAAIHAAGRPEEAADRVAAGFDMCTTTSDLALLRAGADDDLARIRAAAERMRSDGQQGGDRDRVASR